MKTKASYLKCIRFVLLPLMFHLSQAETLIPDLSLIESGNEWEIINRKVTVEHEGGQVVARFRAENDQPGIAWLKTIDFKNGTIEVDLRGENVVGKSFLGIAFHRKDAENYEVIYFRPFNFGPERNCNGRSVQYVAHPDFPWHRLRSEYPGTYENAVKPAPDPDGFFHVKIVIENPSIRVYVEGNLEPSLVVEERVDASGGNLGFWMDYVSGGSFSNLKITPAGNEPLSIF